MWLVVTVVGNHVWSTSGIYSFIVLCQERWEINARKNSHGCQLAFFCIRKPPPRPPLFCAWYSGGFSVKDGEKQLEKLLLGDTLR